jgi:hypothetical protein
VKYFYNVRNARPYIQDIKIINTFRNKVSDIKAVEEISMKKPKSLTHALRLLKPGLDFLSLVARGPLRRSRTTGKSTRPTEEVTRIVDVAEIANNIP